MRTRALLPVGLLLLLSLFLISSVPVLAAGVTVAPTAGAAGTVFSFQVSGLSPDEGVSLWMTRPDLTTVGQPGGQADSAGNFAFKVNSTGYGTGTYYQVVHGNSSGIEFTVQFSVQGGSPGGAPPPSGGGGGGSGGGAKFYGTGFSPNESISVWGLFSDGVVRAMPSQGADGNGVVSFTVTGQAGWPGGDILVVAHGNSSGREVVNTLNLQTGAGGGGGGIPGLPPSGGGGGGGGTGARFYGTGFNPYEGLSVWGQFSDGVVRAMPSQSADGNGVANFTIKPDPSWPGGDVLVVAHGNNSGREVVNTLNLQTGAGGGGGGGSLPPPTGGQNPLWGFSNPGGYVGQSLSSFIRSDCGNSGWWPKYGASNTIYIGYVGFSPGEGVAFWASLPDLSVIGLGSGSADDHGTAMTRIVPTATQMGGHYHVIGHGLNSGREFCGHFDYVR